MYHIKLMLGLLFLTHSAFGQWGIDKHVLAVKDLEILIKNETKDSLKLAISKKMEKEITNILMDEHAFDFDFDFKYIAALKSEDGLFLVISWAIPLNNGTFQNFGYFAYSYGRGKTKIYQFKMLAEQLNSPEMMRNGKSGWTPVQYYRLITVEDKRKTFYTLLGWDGKDDLSNVKVIDILRFSNSGTILVGDKIIYGKGKYLGHLEFEYQERSMMKLNYENGAIVFDHLQPIEPQYQGMPHYYGPDGTYDGLIFQDGRWNLIEAIDVRNPKMKEIPKPKKSY